MLQNSQDRRHNLPAGGGLDTEHCAPFWISESAPRTLRPEQISNPAFDRIMERIPVDLRRTFTHDQLIALSRASVVVKSPHMIDYRVSIPFFGKRFYLTVLAGRERRSLARLAAEMQLVSVQISKLNTTVLGILLTAGILAAAIAIYVIKSALGVDLFVGDSAMHDVLRIMNDPPAL